ncbi:hypothetical protein LTR04_004093 [Oleoguttula sp. CCFEE 6159]|nr:hypothetical protein LTR04_004093 [Oleoguttula sp. CCFEE 6159]
MSPFLQGSTTPEPLVEVRRTSVVEREAASKKEPAPAAPPPINRAGKPQFSKPSVPTDQSHEDRLAPESKPAVSDERVSPFNTPPSSNESTPAEMLPPPVPRRVESKVRTPSIQRDSYFDPPPLHHAQGDKRRAQDLRPMSRSPTFPAHTPSVAGGQVNNGRKLPAADDLPELRPGLPPRRDLFISESRENLARPLEPRGSAGMPRRAATVTGRSDPQFLPPPRRNQPSISPRMSLDHQPTSQSGIRSLTRTSLDIRRGQTPQTGDGHSYADDIEEPPQPGLGAHPALTDYPDSSQANRRPPCYRERPWEIATGYDTRLFAVCGEYVCTTGYVTRVWNLRTGESSMTLQHGDTVKVTALAFKPARNVEDEGKRLWLGTNAGEIQEVDIPTRSVIHALPNAHPRGEIVKIYRHASEMWSLDDDGRLHVWSPDETGSPSLKHGHQSFHVPKGHSSSLVMGNQLWIATGKEIRVFQPSSDANTTFQLLQKPLSQPNVGEVTSCATISSQADRIYFGHADGKVTVYSHKEFVCLDVVNVSLYKMSSLAGIGDYLWAGYNSGMVYVYDTTPHPWKVKKDWHAHDKPVASIVVDQTSVWKLDRLQVASLGIDNTIRLWDGMLKDDWLEAQMQHHDTEYCDFREITALVMTWNAGAVKPTSLRNDERDANFFRDLFRSGEPPDLFVFGFQELVDLEDKKVTAKSFFKSKKKDSSESEHMSHQYRAWRDHLTRSLEEHMPTSEPYTLVHTANMVGLFTCVFLKASERSRIHHINAAEIKRGMGGLHGNKGALVMRFMLDDSSLCFVNCHLAAGQSQTINRNNDVTAILESDPLPVLADNLDYSDMFVGGGDGSMIFDHEICILNGDLNYRIDAMPRNTVVNAVRSNNLAKLIERDQLLLSRKRNPGFRLRAFNEWPITFAPTYKYDVGTDNYDSSEKKRSPAWCDRLLYRGVGRVKQLDYRRHEVRVSDHRPVTGRFKLRVKTVDSERRAKTWDKCKQEFEVVKQRVGAEAK